MNDEERKEICLRKRQIIKGDLVNSKLKQKLCYVQRFKELKTVDDMEVLLHEDFSQFLPEISSNLLANSVCDIGKTLAAVSDLQAIYSDFLDTFLETLRRSLVSNLEVNLKKKSRLLNDLIVLTELFMVGIFNSPSFYGSLVKILKKTSLPLKAEYMIYTLHINNDTEKALRLRELFVTIYDKEIAKDNHYETPNVKTLQKLLNRVDESSSEKELFKIEFQPDEFADYAQESKHVSPSNIVERDFRVVFDRIVNSFSYDKELGVYLANSLCSKDLIRVFLLVGHKHEYKIGLIVKCAICINDSSKKLLTHVLDMMKQSPAEARRKKYSYDVLCLFLCEMAKYRRVSDEDIFEILDCALKERKFERIAKIVDNIGRWFYYNDRTQIRINTFMKKLLSSNLSLQERIFLSGALNTLFTTGATIKPSIDSFFAWLFAKDSLDLGTVNTIVADNPFIIKIYLLKPWLVSDVVRIYTIAKNYGLLDWYKRASVKLLVYSIRNNQRQRAVLFANISSYFLSIDRSSEAMVSKIFKMVLKENTELVFKVSLLLALLTYQTADYKQEKSKILGEIVGVSDSSDLRILWVNWVRENNVEL